MATKNDLDQSETPQLCKTCCTFFGNPETRNLCSVCYKTELNKEISEHKKTLDDICSVRFKTELKKEASEHTKTLDVHVAVENPLETNTSNSVDVKKRNRCHVCNKRAGLVPFGCRCGRIFCGSHRMPEEHACEYNFKAAGRVVLEKENPIIVVDKLETRI